MECCASLAGLYCAGTAPPLASPADQSEETETNGFNDESDETCTKQHSEKDDLFLKRMQEINDNFLKEAGEELFHFTHKPFHSPLGLREICEKIFNDWLKDDFSCTS